jgi:hypothetical protein
MAMTTSSNHHGDMHMGRLGLVILMMAVTAAAAFAGSLIAGGGGAAIGAVSGVGVSALGETGKRWLDSRDDRRQLREQTFLPLSSRPPAAPAPTPAAMLVPERAIVPFIGCEQELAELIDWCVHWNDDPLRLLVGVGGSGKTRLIRELATKLTNWDCNWVRTGEEAKALTVIRRQKSLLVVDYAETKSRDNLGKLIRNLAWPPGRKNIRVLLIARAAGDWWRELIEKTDTMQERQIMSRAVHMKLAPIKGGDNIAAQHYQTAVKAFSEALSQAARSSDIPAFNQDSPVLVIHVAALLAVLGPSGLSARQYDQLLDHEDRYWNRTAGSCGLTSLSRKARRESVAELTLSGASTITDIAEQLKRVPDLAGTLPAERRAVAQWLQNLYPAQDLDSLGSFRPHLLAEHLAVRELTTDREFFSRALRHLSHRRAHHAFTVLGHAAQHDQEATRIIAESVAADPEDMILPAVSAVVETGVLLDAMLAAQVQATPLDTLQLARISAAIPWKSNSLDRTATVVRRRFFEAATAELTAITSPSASHSEIERRQIELMEFSRVNRMYRKQGRALPPGIRQQLIRALEGQEKALVSSGQLQAAQEISRQIAWVQLND